MTRPSGDAGAATFVALDQESFEALGGSGLATYAEALSEFADNLDTYNASIAELLDTAYTGDFETIAAEQTAQVLGDTGAAGDYLDKLIITPALVACGVVTLLDGATSIPIFVGGGTTALADAKPFVVPIGARCATAWKVTTGASVSVLAVGNFT